MEWTEKLSFNHGKGHVRDFAKPSGQTEKKRFSALDVPVSWGRGEEIDKHQSPGARWNARLGVSLVQ